MASTERIHDATRGPARECHVPSDSPAVGSSAPATPLRRYAEDLHAYLNRLRRIESQVRDLRTMVAAGAPP